MKILSCILALLFLLLFAGCEDRYYASVTDDLGNVLVVEGVITDGVTTIRLTRSVKLNEDVWKSRRVSGAALSVECENGNVFKADPEAEEGIYNIPTGILDPAARYRLRIFADGKEYESEYLQPQITPAIDAVELLKPDLNQPVSLTVTTHGSEEQSRYYMWSYNEIWEIKAYQHVVRAYSEDGVLTDYGSGGEYDKPLYPFHYCWLYGQSQSLLLGSSDKFGANVIDRKKLQEFLPTSPRFSILYYINVKQNSLREVAYKYFTNIQKNSEQTGGIFSPIPMEIQGNIRCVSDPDLPVIGYMEVSTTASQEIFIPSPNDLYEEPWAECITLNDKEHVIPDNYLPYGIIQLPPDLIIWLLYSQRECVDCRALGGTKRRPAFWPTDHY